MLNQQLRSLLAFGWADIEAQNPKTSKYLYTFSRKITIFIIETIKAIICSRKAIEAYFKENERKGYK